MIVQHDFGQAGGLIEDTQVRVQVYVEVVFFCIKHIFGGYVPANKFVTMAKEIVVNASFYNGFIGTA
ncbi:MAG: hypothetical protein JRN68_02305 [Nitrososphaerota archaeon]|nr:hypothetical protein [Nitrososphaerota archaeon]